MRVSELMTSQPEACTPWDTCDVAGEIMRRRRCGFVPVIESQEMRHVVGVLTDRDLAMYLTRTNASANQVAVETVMTREPITIDPDADLGEAARLMETIAVHRLPVVKDSQLVGVLSLKDIALVARKQWAYSGPHIAERQMTEIIEAIAAAR